MRFLSAFLCLAMLVPFLGCESGGKRIIFGPTPAPTPSPAGVPSAEALVEYLNDNARRIQGLRCVDVDVEASQKITSVNVRAKMMSMKPRSFLMTASALGNSMLDLGSNDNEFWFWFSKAPEPYQFYCSYKDFEEGKVTRFPFPFQPDWIMESLGMGPYGPASKYTLEHDATTLKLVEKTRTPQGMAVRKVIVIARRPVAPPQPQVQSFLLLDDATGKELCSAQVQEVLIDHATGAVVPKRLELRVPSESLRLRIAFNKMEVNPQLNPAAFQRQTMPGVQSFDLARGPNAPR
jgi:hypothetical protein